MTTSEPEAPEPEAPEPEAEQEAPPSPGQSTDGPRVSREEALDLARLRRSTTDRHVAGVAGGLARHFDIDPVIVRVLFVVTGLFGVGLVAYAALWALVPEDHAAKAPIGLDEGTRKVALIVLAVLSALALVGTIGDPDMGGIVFLGLVALGVVVFLKNREQRAAQRTAAIHPAAAPAYAGSAPLAGGYDPPPADYRPTPSTNPRKRGPVLFAGTIALLLFTLGLLGLLDVAGVAVPHSGYPALAVAVIGLMLLIGAWWGRAGGLIALGLAATMVLAASSGAENFDGDRTIRPTSSGLVLDAYEVRLGELVLDLSDVSDPEALAGRLIQIDGGAGHIVLVVPDDVDSRVEASVDGPGNIKILGTDLGGVETSQTWRNDTPGTGLVTFDVELGVGEIEVRTS